jgi:hypothetical protein
MKFFPKEVDVQNEIDKNLTFLLIQGAVIQLSPNNVGSYYAVVDLYGQCSEISLDESAEPQKSESIVIPISEKSDSKKCNTSGVLNKNCCEYLNLCQRFKASLVLPSNFFASPPEVLCYCVSCCKVSHKFVCIT